MNRSLARMGWPAAPCRRLVNTSLPDSTTQAVVGILIPFSQRRVIHQIATPQVAQQQAVRALARPVLAGRLTADDAHQRWA